MTCKKQFSARELETVVMENVKDIADLLIAKLQLVLANTVNFGYGSHDTLEHILLFGGTEG
jgi:hypothetical protein